VQAFLLSIDRMSTFVGKIFAWLIVLLTLVTTYDVLVTFLFRAPTLWAYDVSVFMYGTLFMMGGAYALARNAHVRGDIFYRNWPVKVQAGVDLALYVLFFFPGVLALLSVGTQWAQLSWTMRELSSQSPIQTPIYQFKTVIPLAAFFILIQGIAETIRCVIALRTGVWPPRLGDVEETETKLAKQEQV
jgi:TRAP-type mannitol/chloroaromatic compound transport system permease small subunit